ncbi:MAG: hypothetical protein Kow0059_09140 [Candidatus Sumerlaeia bacterium]
MKPIKIKRRIRAVALLWVLITWVVSVQADIPPGYYDGTDGLSDAALLVKLRQITTNGHVARSYSATSDYMFIMDADAQGRVRCVYTGRLHDGGSGLNVEHTWPRSRGADVSPRESDLHHLFPTETEINSRRGNLPFDNIAVPDYTDGGSKVLNNVAFEPRDDHKGNAARAVFYFSMRYDLPLVSTGYVLGTSEDKMGFENTLRTWHQLDPPDDAERARNDAIYAWQGNRNPFVDHPEFVGRIGSFGGSTVTPTPTPTGTPTPTPTLTPTPTPPPAPTPTPGGADLLDVSGWKLQQYNSTQSFIFPSGTYLMAGGFLIVARNAGKTPFESAWGVTLGENVTFVNSGDFAPKINGDEEFELFDDQNQSVGGGRTITSTLVLGAGDIARRSATNSTVWSVVSGPADGPAQTSYEMNGVGPVIMKFGDGADFNMEFVEIFYDATPSAAWSDGFLLH